MFISQPKQLLWSESSLEEFISLWNESLDAKNTIKLYVVWTKIIVAQKEVTFHFRGLYFFLKISIITTLIGPYFPKTSTHAHLKYWISLRSQPFQGFLWLNIDFASSQGGLIHLGEFSRRGWGGDLSFHRVNDITAPFLCREICMRNLTLGRIHCQSSGLQEASDEQKGSFKRSGRRIKNAKRKHRDASDRFGRSEM